MYGRNERPGGEALSYLLLCEGPCLFRCHDASVSVTVVGSGTLFALVGWGVAVGLSARLGAVAVDGCRKSGSLSTGAVDKLVLEICATENRDEGVLCCGNG